jgi:hypothetical protein
MSDIVSDDDLKALTTGVTRTGGWAKFFEPPDERKPAPESTFEALMYQLRFGTYVLEHARAKERLSKINGEQLQRACALLRRRKMPIGEPWDDEAIKLLVSTWRTKRPRH